MNAIVKKYVQDILSNLVAEEAMKGRIEKDLYAHIAELSEHQDVERVINRMGAPEDVAREFMESIYEDKNQAIELIQERMKTDALEQNQGYEYKSRATLFGLPLVHINHSGQGRRLRVARGIIALGDIAVGLISFGGIALGGISFGGLSLGLLSIGGMALGGLSAGGLAIGFAAFGGLAIGQIAFGGLAIGQLAVGSRAIGEFALETEQHTVTRESVHELFHSAYPGMKDWMRQILTWILK